MTTSTLNEAIRIRLRENREREQLRAELESMSPVEQSREQQSEFPIPGFVQPLACGLGLRVACSDARAEQKNAAIGLVRRLCREPEAVLEDVLLAQQRDSGCSQVDPSGGMWGAESRPRLKGAQARCQRATAGLVDPERASMQQVAAALDVAAVGQLRECQQPGCRMGRLAYPQVRAAGEREIARTLWQRFADTPTLQLSLVGPGGCFAESVMFARLYEQGFRRLEVNLVETQFRPIVDAARGEFIVGPRLGGYSARMHEVQCQRLGQVVDLMGAAFDHFALHAFSSAVDCIGAHAAGQLPSSHATLCLDPGLEGIVVLDIRWNAALLQACTGTPGGLLAVADAAPGLLITQPVRRACSDGGLPQTSADNPAYWVGRAYEPEGETGMRRAMAALEAMEGPVVVQRDLTAALSAGCGFRLSETFRGWGAQGQMWAAGIAVVLSGLAWRSMRVAAI